MVFCEIFEVASSQFIPVSWTRQSTNFSLIISVNIKDAQTTSPFNKSLKFTLCRACISNSSPRHAKRFRIWSWFTWPISSDIHHSPRAYQRGVQARWSSPHSCSSYSYKLEHSAFRILVLQYQLGQGPFPKKMFQIRSSSLCFSRVLQLQFWYNVP